MIAELFNAMQFEFMQNAIITGLLISIACGIIGTYVVLKRIVFLSGGVAHAAYGGIGLGYLLQIPPLVMAVLFSLYRSINARGTPASPATRVMSAVMIFQSALNLKAPIPIFLKTDSTKHWSSW